MADYAPGRRYPMTLKEASAVMAQGWPAVRGTPDLARGRRFVKAPCSWEFWTADGRKVSFDFQPGLSCVVSQSRTPDPDRPPPLAPDGEEPCTDVTPGTTASASSRPKGPAAGGPPSGS